MAWESCSSATAISIDFLSSSTTIDKTSAGDIALITNLAGSSSHIMISILSPLNSLDTDCTRDPLIPTHAPMASSFGSLDFTEILALKPGSLAAPNISTNPCPTSGTSSLNSSTRNSGSFLVIYSWGPRSSAWTSRK